MQVDRSVLAGVAGLIVGAVLAYAVGSSGRADLQAQLRQQDDVVANVAALSEAVAGLDARVAGLDARLDELSGAIAEAGDVPEVDLEPLAGRIEDLGGQMSRLFADVGERVTEALQADLDALRDRLAAIGERPAATPEEMALVPGDGETVRIGETIAFADGALRIFLSSVDAEAGTARVAINGTMLSTLEVAQPLHVGDCRVELTGIDHGTATIDGGC